MSIQSKFDDLVRDLEASIAQSTLVQSEKKSWEEANFTLKTRLQKLSDDEKKIKADKEQLEQEHLYVKKQQEEYDVRMALLVKEWEKYKEAKAHLIDREKKVELLEQKYVGLDELMTSVKTKENAIQKEIEVDRDRKNALNLREKKIEEERERLARITQGM